MHHALYMQMLSVWTKVTQPASLQADLISGLGDTKPVV